MARYEWNPEHGEGWLWRVNSGHPWLKPVRLTLILLLGLVILLGAVAVVAALTWFVVSLANQGYY